MAPILQIAGQVLSRVLIATIAWSMTFVGYNADLKLSRGTSTPIQLNTTPIFVEIQNSNSFIQKNKITDEKISTTTGTTTKNSKIVKKETLKQTSEIQHPTPKTSDPTTQVPAPVVTPIKETVSLKNLPVPSIELPEVTSEINRGIALGEMGNIYSNSKQSVVNIFCVSTKGNMVSISTGSGVIISSSGIILTNSHVAENFLIPNRNCSIRQGDVAVDKYKASLVYINENWLKKNAGVLFSQGSRGTGEGDFALVSINSKSDGSNTNLNITHTNINLNELSNKNQSDKILIAGYPAGTLGALSMMKYLTFIADVINISNVYTLDGSHIDVLETSITKVGQHGSSGGGIFNTDNNLLALIVSVNDESANSKVNAITTTYINRALQNETGKSLQEFVNTDKNILLSNFLLKKDSLFEYVKPFVK